MDPLGATASVVTLIQVTTVLTKSIQSICSRWRRAPEELQALAVLLLSLGAELDIIVHCAATACHPLLVDIRSQKALAELLREARDCVEQLEAVLTNVQEYGDFRQRTMWATNESRRMDKVIIRFRNVEDRLSRWLQAMSLKSQCLALADIGVLKQMVANLATSTITRAVMSPPRVGALATKATGTSKRTLQWKPTSLEESWASWGVRYSLIPTSQGPYRDFCVAMQISVPLACILGRYMFVMAVSIRTFPLCPLSLSLRHGSSFALVRVLDNDHKFLVACDRGDLIAVRSMLQDGQGRPTDIGDKNWTPLAFAIRSGRTDIVGELLDNGADVDGSFGLMQTSPLQFAVWHQQLDVVHLLLRRGASQDHINTIGWNVTFFCWPRLEFGRRSMLDHLNLLADHAIQELEAVDTEGWTVLHRVAAYATAVELLELIRQGARPEQEALPLRWNALHHAVFYGNEETYKALIPHFAGDMTSMLDERGWTLLHIAASAGHGTIAQDLLERGANPDALSKPFMSHMPASLHGRACTPRQVALAQSPEREAQYVEVMRTCGKLDMASTTHGSSCSVDDEGDIFWEANEILV